jgi:hypothetical protein
LCLLIIQDLAIGLLHTRRPTAINSRQRHCYGSTTVGHGQPLIFICAGHHQERAELLRALASSTMPQPCAHKPCNWLTSTFHGTSQARRHSRNRDLLKHLISSLTAVALLERVFSLVDRDSGKWFVNVVCTRPSIFASKKQLLRPISAIGAEGERGSG